MKAAQGDAEQTKVLKNYQTPRKFMYSYLSYLTIYGFYQSAGLHV
ncbi:hypothetical protein [Snodgrassella sp. CS2]